MTKYIIAFLGILLLLTSCQSEKNKPQNSIEPVALIWTLESVSLNNASMPKATSLVSITLTNQSNQALTSTNWSLHYNQLGGSPIIKSLPSDITITNPAGDYFILKPMALWKTLKKGESRKLSITLDGVVDKMSETPRGTFIVIDKNPTNLKNVKVEGINANTLAATNPTTDESRYAEYNKLSLLSAEELLPFFPSPVKYIPGNGKLIIKENLTIGGNFTANTAINSLKSHSKRLSLSVIEKSKDPMLTISKVSNLGSEAYRMTINNGGIEITASSEQGAFYAVQSLLQMLYIASNTGSSTLELPYATIEDAPRFDYRGMHLDVARNFHKKEAVMKILDQMSLFKLNKFHFHITDDEGWRIEIPELPELTSVGSRRGYTEDESDILIPTFGSGGNPDDSYGSGQYSQADYIEILQYAAARHIEVIPEIDVPGHARAAIKSMSARYNRLIKEGKESEANQYLLHDTNDQSEYKSAQGYTDNVICVCQDGAYNFMELIISTIIKLHESAGVNLTTIHVGGDEIPHGVWEKSPICEQFITDHEDVNSTAEIQSYFFRQLRTFINDRGLIMAGWEEILLAHDEKGHNTTDINMSLIDPQTLPYVWNAVWGWDREDMVYKLANAGSPVIMCNSAAFYFDMAYDKDPQEIGLSWSGFSDTKTIYGLDPLDMFKNARYDVAGKPLIADSIANKTRLTDIGRKNFKGIQAQLWSETIIEEKWLDYMIFPKMFAFAERAWSPPGLWMQANTSQEVDEQFQSSWNVFANSVGQRGLPFIEKTFENINYRKPKMGKNAQGETNIEFPRSTSGQ